MNFTPQEITQEETRLVNRTVRDVLREYNLAEDIRRHIKEDLLHEGIMGLLEARKKYDPERGVPWLAFAAYRIRGSILDALRKAPQVRIPQEAYRKIKAFREASEALRQEMGHNDPLMLADRLGWSLEEVQAVRQLSPSLAEISDTDDEDVDDRPTGFVLADTYTPDPENVATRKQIAGLVQDCLEKIPSDTDRLVLLGRLLEGLKLRELADMIDCSLENIRLTQKKVEGWMRTCLEKQGVSSDGLLRLMH